nr:hypothetical protein [Candidatus Sigynarchaeota archaeon]
MVNKGELQEIDKLIFSSGDSYVVDEGNTIWLWHGKNASPDEKATAAVSAKKMDDERGGKPKVIAIDQGDFTPHARRFKELCSENGGLKIMDKNIAESFLTHFTKASIPPVMFKVSSEEYGGDINAMEYVQVPAKKENLDSDDVMVLYVYDANTCFIWIGKGANVKERVVARRVAMNFEKDLPGDQKEVFMEEGEEVPDFWKYLN